MADSPELTATRSRPRYLRPSSSGDATLPIVVSYAGYGGGRGIPAEHLARPAIGISVLVMDNRSQSAMWTVGATGDPGRSGGNPEDPGLMTRGITSPRPTTSQDFSPTRSVQWMSRSICRAWTGTASLSWAGARAVGWPHHPGTLGFHAARAQHQPRRNDLLQSLRTRRHRRLAAPHHRWPRTPSTRDTD